MKNYLLILAFSLLSSISFSQTTWYEIPTGTTKKMNAIDFPSNNVGYIVGNDSLILKTTNGGQTWTELGMNGITISSLSHDFTDIDFIDENIGFLVAQYSGVFKTIDGGQSWSQMGSSMCFPETLFLFGETDYLIGGGDCFTGVKIDRITNNVLSPANVNAPLWGDFQIALEMSFSGTNRGLAATRTEYILRTIDGGNNWDTISTGITGVLTSVVMVDDTLCYAGYDENGGGFGILKSIDGGLTWEQDINSATFFYPAYLSVHAAANGDIYSGAVPSNPIGGLIFESEDGISWDYQHVDQPINYMTSYGDDITFGVGDSGYLVVNTPIAELGINEPNDIEFSLYPNPVLNELNVHNPQLETMEITILDLKGRVLKSEKAHEGLTTIDTSDLSKGLYLVKVRIGNKFGLRKIIK